MRVEKRRNRPYTIKITEDVKIGEEVILERGDIIQVFEGKKRPAKKREDDDQDDDEDDMDDEEDDDEDEDETEESTRRKTKKQK